MERWRQRNTGRRNREQRRPEREQGKTDRKA